MDVGDWLRSLGLGQYETLFRQNDIDAEVLSELTEGDLEKFGVSFGHRKRLLKAIASLGSTETAVKPAAPVALQTSTDAAERRQLTVMFCDLVGSTAMSARLDPEDMREIIGVHHRCCAALIEHNGGFVAKYMGDGVLAYFGYPQAHEHDAERAVQAGLAIVEAAPKLVTTAGSPLHVRVGIATGLVVVGDLIGSGEAQERGVVGDTPNLAARLQSIADPDMVVIAEGTRRLLGNLFELLDLGARDLKGIAGPTRAWAALRPSSAESRFEALHATGLTALVGREEEFDVLLRRWAKAKIGEGQVVLLYGEAGIGKSRLTAALLERLASEPHTRLRYFCSPQATDSPLFPIIGQMERAAGFAHDDKAQAKLDKLDALLAQTATSKQDAALLAEMLSLLNDGRYPRLELAPPRRRQKTFEALDAQLEALARQKPVLMIVEDVHWADPTSLEAFGRAVDRIGTHRVLLVVTFRPEFSSPWIGQPRVTALTLNRLTGHDIETMIDRVAGNKNLPASIRQDIIERTDGIPLFVEEMTKAVLEAGARQLRRRRLPWPHRRQQLFRRACMPRCWRGLTASVPPRRSLRSGRRSAASFPMRYWRRWQANPRCSSLRRSTGSLRRACCSAKACRRTQRPATADPLCPKGLRPSRSSAPQWNGAPAAPAVFVQTRAGGGFPPTARCCASGAACCMPRSPRPWRSQFPDIAKNQDRGFGSMPNAEVHHATLVILAMSTAHVMPVADMAARVVSGRPSGEFPSRAA